MERPKPVPLPIGLVVKKGSKIWDCSAGLMPGPLSAIWITMLEGDAARVRGGESSASVATVSCLVPSLTLVRIVILLGEVLICSKVRTQLYSSRASITLLTTFINTWL